MGHYADESRWRRWWDVFLDAGVSLAPLWLVLFCLVYIAVRRLLGV